MKTITSFITLIALITTAAFAETVEIQGKQIELPPSKVSGTLRNPDILPQVLALRDKVYMGTTLATDLKVLEARVRGEGSTDFNVATLASLTKKIADADKPTVPTGNPDKIAAFNRAIQAGFDTGLGYRLAMGDDVRNNLAQLTLLVVVAKQNGLIDDKTPQNITDLGGDVRTVTTAQFIRLMLGYGANYKRLWDALKSGD